MRRDVQIMKRASNILCCLVLMIILYPMVSSATYVSEKDVATVTKSWLESNESPMNLILGSSIKSILNYPGNLGNHGYYLVIGRCNVKFVANKRSETPKDTVAKSIKHLGLTAPAF